MLAAAAARGRDANRAGLRRTARELSRIRRCGRLVCARSRKARESASRRCCRTRSKPASPCSACSRPARSWCRSIRCTRAREDRGRRSAGTDAASRAASRSSEISQLSLRTKSASRFPIPEALALLQYTGGTTGKPKGVNLTHRAIATNVAQREALLPTALDRERILCVMPLFHSYAMAMGLFLAANCRGTLVILERYRPEIVLAADRDASASPSSRAARRCSPACSAHPDFARTDWSSVHTCYSGSAALPEETLKRWQRRGRRAGVRGLWPDRGRAGADLQSRARRNEARLGRHPGAANRDPHRRGRDRWRAGRRSCRATATGRRRPPRRCATAGCIPATWASSTPTAISTSAAARRTWSSSAATTSIRARWRRCCAAIPAVAEAAVVGGPDPYWGECLHAYVALRQAVDAATPALATARSAWRTTRFPATLEIRRQRCRRPAWASSTSLPLKATMEVLDAAPSARCRRCCARAAARFAARTLCSHSGRAVVARRRGRASPRGAPARCARPASSAATASRVMCSNRAELLEMFLACGWIGAVCVPINTASMGPQIEYYLTNSGAKLLVIEKRFLVRLQTRHRGCHGSWTTIYPAAGGEPSSRPTSSRARPSPSSTPREPPGRRRAWPARMRSTTGGAATPRDILGVGADDVLCTTLPLFHINALNTFAQAAARRLPRGVRAALFGLRVLGDDAKPPGDAWSISSARWCRSFLRNPRARSSARTACA